MMENFQKKYRTSPIKQLLLMRDSVPYLDETHETVMILQTGGAARAAG